MSGEIEAALEKLAKRQYGLLTRRQMLRAGLTEREIDLRLKKRRLRRLHKGVYQVGPFALPKARELAAALACGPRAAISHWSSGWLWGFLDRPSTREPVDVQVHESVRIRRKGIRLHRSKHFCDDDVTMLDGIPVTVPARTLLDLAPVVSVETLERAVARAERARLVTVPELAELVVRHRGRPGIPKLAAVIAVEGGPAFIRSALEAKFVRESREYGLPVALRNVKVLGEERDFHWPELRFVVEVDGAAFHESWESQEADRKRDGALSAAGIQVLRLTWNQLFKETKPTMAIVAQALAVCRYRVDNERK